MRSLRIIQRIRARNAFRLATQLAVVGASLSPPHFAQAQVTFGGVEVAPGLSVGGTTLHPDGTTTFGGIQAGGVRAGSGLSVGGATVGGYNPERQRREDEERERRRRSEEEDRERRRRDDEYRARRLRESEDDDRRRRANEDDRRARTQAESRRQADEVNNQREARRQAVERGQFQEPFKNLSFKLEVVTSSQTCANKSAIDCWRSIPEDRHVGMQTLSIQSAERVQEEIAFLAQRHAIQLELADRQAGGHSRVCDINDCNGNPDLLRHSRRQLQNFKLAYDEFFRSARVPVSFHQLARRHGITDIQITFRVLLTRDRLIDAMQVNDASQVSLGERRVITNLVANSNDLIAPRPDFAIFQLLNIEFPDSIRNAIQRAGYPSAPIPAATPTPSVRPRR